MHGRHEFAVTPPSPLIYGLLGAIWLVVVTVVLVRTDVGAWRADPVPWWLPPLFASALIVVGPLVWLSRRDISIEAGELRVAAGLNTQTLAIRDLMLDKARILDLDEHTGFKPMLQLFGAGLPGYKSGHYLLRNRARAFVLLTRRGKVLLLPRRDGKYLLLSPEHPQALLDALRESATGVAA